MSWSLRFAEPTVLPDGGELTTLREAIAHLGKIIPKYAHDMPEVQTAAELLTNAAEHGGPVEFARIATLQAINRYVGRMSSPRAKTPNGDAASRHTFRNHGDVADLGVAIVRRDRIRRLGVAGIVLGTTLDATDVLRADTGRSRTDQSAV